VILLSAAILAVLIVLPLWLRYRRTDTTPEPPSPPSALPTPDVPKGGDGNAVQFK
jgi:hypothetical protein